MGPEFSLPTNFLNCFATESLLFVPLKKLNNCSLEITRSSKWRSKNRKGFLDKFCQAKQFDWPCLSLRISIWGVRHHWQVLPKKSVFFKYFKSPPSFWWVFSWHSKNEWKMSLCLPLVSQHWCEEHPNSRTALDFSLCCRDSC